MKKMKIAALLLAAALVATAFAGCGESKAQTGETKTQTSDSAVQEQDQQQDQPQTPENGKGTMAKIVSLDSDQLTVVLADMPDGSRGDGQAPADRATPPDGSKPSDGSAPASGPAVKSSGEPAGQPGKSDQNGQPGQSDQNGQPGQGGGKIQFTGEQVTYTVSKDVQITKGTGDSATEIDLSELAAGDVITFTTGTDDSGSEVVDSIQVLDRIN